jgi:hypothetical protein
MMKQKNDDDMIDDKMMATNEQSTGSTCAPVRDGPRGEPVFSTDVRCSETCGPDAARVHRSAGIIGDSDMLAAVDNTVRVRDGKVAQVASEAALRGVTGTSHCGNYERLRAKPCPVRRQGNDRTEVGSAKVAGAPGGYCMMMHGGYGGYGGNYQMHAPPAGRQELLGILSDRGALSSECEEAMDENWRLHQMESSTATRNANPVLVILLSKVARVAAEDGVDWRDVVREYPLSTIDERVTDFEAVDGDFYQEFPNPAYDDDYHEDAEEEHEGEVTHWDAEKGFGFLIDPDGDRIFFHVSGLSVKDDQTYLRDCFGAGIFDPRVNFRYEWQEERREYKAVDVYWRSYDYDSE